MSELRRSHPYEFFTRGNTIRANVESVKRRRWEYTPDFAADSFVIPGAVQDWLDTEFDEEVSHRILIHLFLINVEFQLCLGKRRPTQGPHARRCQQNGENPVGAVIREAYFF